MLGRDWGDALLSSGVPRSWRSIWKFRAVHRRTTPVDVHVGGERLAEGLGQPKGALRLPPRDVLTGDGGERVEQAPGRALAERSGPQLLVILEDLEHFLAQAPLQR